MLEQKETGLYHKVSIDSFTLAGIDLGFTITLDFNMMILFYIDSQLVVEIL